MAVIAAFRISAIAWGWTLPVFSLKEPGPGHAGGDEHWWRLRMTRGLRLLRR
jgi:hypothetical protein